MNNPLIRKLERFGSLTDEERQVLKDAIARVRDYRPREDIVREGDTPTESSIILEGFACRYNHLPDGDGKSQPSTSPATLPTCTVSF